MVLLSLLIGCSPQDPESTSTTVCSPGEGEVFWLEGRSTFQSLDAALDATGAWATLCLGPGQHLLEDGLLEDHGWSGQVHLVGAGVDESSLYAPDHPENLVFALGVPEQLVLESLSLESPLGLTAQELVFDNVKMEGVASQDSLLHLSAESLLLQGLVVRDSSFSYGGLILGATEEERSARVQELVWEGNHAYRGTHVISQGYRPVELKDCSVLESFDTGTSLGFPMIQAGGDLSLERCSFVGDRSSASLVYGRSLALTEVDFADSRCATGGFLQAVGSLELERVSIQDSRSANAMMLLYSDSQGQSQAAFSELAMGTELPNTASCDFMVDGLCVRPELGEVEQWSCTDCREAGDP
ncbi:MAG: hypothetical protein VX899_09290 [Myxococcota bacterium]|nr:hypothetical protein [Myxococcota bacterium]